MKNRNKMLGAGIGLAALAAAGAYFLYGKRGARNREKIAGWALNNIGKHSKATIVAVALFRKGKELILSVNDNGIGFNLRSNRSRTGRGIGLGNMCERAESVGGSIELNSTLGVGTMLSAHIPLAGLGESIS